MTMGTKRDASPSWLVLTLRVMSRLGRAVLTLLGVSVLIFVLGKVFVPGDAVTFIVGGEGGSAERIQEIRESLGLDRPLVVQYGIWLRGVLTFDLGVSPVTGRPVADVIREQVGVSVLLASYSLLLSVIVGIPLGVLAAWRSRTIVDAGVRTLVLVGFSIPVFVSGAVGLLAAALNGWGALLSTYTPIQDGLIRHAQAMLLPTVAIAIPVSAVFAQMVRTAMLDTLGQRFLLFARARGVSVRRQLFVHALRNASGPVITLVAFQFGLMIGGLIVIEEIFSLPGLGRGLLTAIAQRDFPYVMVVSMMGAAVFVLANGMADAFQSVIDPRQRRKR